MKETLEELYSHHVGKSSDKWSIYLDIYERIFSEYRELPIRLLEIGIQNGGSLEIWSKYFQHKSVLVGCDINPDCSKLKYEDPRIHIVIGDANSSETQKNILNISDEYDIIIDDGSHNSSDIIKSFAKYFSHLKDGGIFVAEDLHCSYWSQYEGGLHDANSSVSFFKILADVINYEHWGVQSKRSDIFSDIEKKYHVSIDDSILEKVHSVEFFNSMCVIRKNKNSRNILGSRIVAGLEESIIAGNRIHHGSIGSIAPDQSTNLLSAYSLQGRLLDMEKRLFESEKKLLESNKRILSMESSISWKIAAPLRFVFDFLLLAYKKCHFHYTNRGSEYSKWIRLYDRLDNEKKGEILSSITEMIRKPLISVVMPTYNTNIKWLREAIESVRKQLYPHWELCIADDASTRYAVKKLLKKYAESDGRIKVVFREQNGHISAASNSALALATGEWVALFDHDDILPEHALYEVAKAINENPSARLIYSDEDKIDGNGRRLDHYFKPDWNPDLLNSQNYICHLGVYYKAIIDEIGGFREGLEGAQDYDLALRFTERIGSDAIHHIPRVLYHWRIHPKSTAAGTDAKPYSVLAGEKALNEHFEREGIKAVAEWTGCGYRARYETPKEAPLVSIIIPTHNGVNLLRQCIDSLLEKTDYKNYEILIIDNRSDDPQALQYLKEIERMNRIRVLRDHRPFNYSALNNSAVSQAQGEILCFLNNDIEVISPEWLTEMVSHAIRPEIGAVGAMLYYPNKTVQHAGVILVGGVAGHAFKKYELWQRSYGGRIKLIQNYSAVTGACAVIQKKLFEEVGGFDELNLTVAFNDVDLCLKLLKTGYKNLWTPYACLIHHESVSRGEDNTPEKQKRFNDEISYMKKVWPDLLNNDPSYNPNLTFCHEDFSLAWPPRVSI